MKSEGSEISHKEKWIILINLEHSAEVGENHVKHCLKNDKIVPFLVIMSQASLGLENQPGIKGINLLDG
jgi:hypothetical protein